MPTVTAQLRYLRIPARKTRFVADTIRGLSVNEAESRLMVSPRRPSEPLLKLLRSAVANAKNNFKLESGTLYIKEIRVDQGPKQRRYMPRARGSMALIEKKTSHVTIVLDVAEKSQTARYTILPKPKKDKEAAEKKRRAPAKEDDKAAADHAHEHPETAKTMPDKSKTKGGFMKRVFRRKSI
jgi:large subunit ribosomal protein L22